MSSDKMVGNARCTVTLSKGGQCPESAIDGDGLCTAHRTLRDKKIAIEIPKIRAWNKATFSGDYWGADPEALFLRRSRIVSDLAGGALSIAGRAKRQGELDAIDVELKRQAEREPAGVKA